MSGTAMTHDDAGTGAEPPLRLSMTLPGSASLGAFQAGAVAALAVMVNRLRDRGVDVRVDALGGSSAGSIVAMLFAHCLLTGRDAPAVLRDAWVDQVDAELLRSAQPDAPLAFDELRRELVSFLNDQESHPYDVHPPLPDPMTVEVGLTSLLGLHVPVSSRNGSVPTLTFADRSAFELEPGHRPAVLTEPDAMLDAVLASAAHPIAFGPCRLDRSDDRDEIAARGVENLPDQAELWYTDGGLVESEPVKRIIRAAGRRHRDSSGRRLHLIVDPRSSGPSGDERWADPHLDPSWLDGLRRAISVVPTQALHDDIRAVLSTNRRIEAIEEVLDQLSDDLDSGQLDELRTRLLEIGGLDDTDIVDIEMITPLRHTDAPDDAGVSDLLAGDFIGAFGGFLDRRVRRSDFALGWLCARSWIVDELGRYGIEPEAVDHVVEALDADGTVDGDDHDREGDGVDQLDAAGRWQLALLAARFGRVAVGAAVPWHPIRRTRELIERVTQRG